jgi:DHA2 family multidrug resistance protein
MIPTVFTTAFVFFEGRQTVLAAAVIGSLASLAPTLGPTVGGWITDHYSWHWLFFINLIPGLFVTLAVPVMVRVDEPHLDLLKGADYLGILLMAVFLGTLEYSLEEGPRWNWMSDETIRTTAAISAIAGVAFIWRSLTYAHPIVDLRALKNRNFALGCLFSFMAGAGIFSVVYLTPQYLGRVRDFSALQIGWAVFSTGLFQILAIPLYAVLARVLDLRWILMIGFAVFGASMLLFVPLTHEWGAGELLLPQAIRGMAQQLMIPPTVTLALGVLPPERLKLASGLFNLMRNLGGAIGIAVCGTILNDRTNFHFLRLAEHLNQTNTAMTSMMHQLTVGGTAAAAGDAAHGQVAALKVLWAQTMRQAQTMSFSDAFWVILVCFVLTTLLVPLMKKVQLRGGPPAEAH